MILYAVLLNYEVFVRTLCTDCKIGLAWTIPFKKGMLPTYFGQLNFGGGGLILTVRKIPSSSENS